MAGIGDSITQALVKVILLAIAVDFALKGSPVGVLIFIVGFSAYALIVSYFMFNSGYRLGKNAVVDLLRGGRLQSITEALGVVGMIVLGALVAGNINLTTPLVFTIGEVVMEVQPMLNSILPKLLNLVLFFSITKLLKDEKKPNTIIMIVFAAATVFSLLGIL
jgi:mannose/fructose/N-acetylgalactosamine-specific phosphotransferase system component IID